MCGVFLFIIADPEEGSWHKCYVEGKNKIKRKAEVCMTQCTVGVI